MGKLYNPKEKVSEKKLGTQCVCSPQRQVIIKNWIISDNEIHYAENHAVLKTFGWNSTEITTV